MFKVTTKEKYNSIYKFSEQYLMCGTSALNEPNIEHSINISTVRVQIDLYSASKAVF